MSTGFAFRRRLHLCSVSSLRIVVVFQLRTFKARKLSGAFEKRAPGPLWIPASVLNGLPWLNKVTYLLRFSHSMWTQPFIFVTIGVKRVVIQRSSTF